MTENERIEKGRAIRRQVLGAAHVDQSGAAPTKMQAAFRTANWMWLSREKAAVG